MEYSPGSLVTFSIVLCVGACVYGVYTYGFVLILCGNIFGPIFYFSTTFFHVTFDQTDGKIIVYIIIWTFCACPAAASASFTFCVM